MNPKLETAGRRGAMILPFQLLHRVLIIAPGRQEGYVAIVQLKREDEKLQNPLLLSLALSSWLLPASGMTLEPLQGSTVLWKRYLLDTSSEITGYDP